MSQYAGKLFTRARAHAHVRDDDLLDQDPSLYVATSGGVESRATEPCRQPLWPCLSDADAEHCTRNQPELTTTHLYSDPGPHSLTHE